jgi:hypothetical protein
MAKDVNCKECRYDGRIRGQHTNICTNRAVNKKHGQSSNRKNLNAYSWEDVKYKKSIWEMCGKGDYWRPRTFLQRIVQRFWDWGNAKAVNDATLDAEILDYESGQWRESAEDDLEPLDQRSVSHD